MDERRRGPWDGPPGRPVEPADRGSAAAAAVPAALAALAAAGGPGGGGRAAVGVGRRACGAAALALPIGAAAGAIAERRRWRGAGAAGSARPVAERTVGERGGPAIEPAGRPARAGQARPAPERVRRPLRRPPWRSSRRPGDRPTRMPDPKRPVRPALERPGDPLSSGSFDDRRRWSAGSTRDAPLDRGQPGAAGLPRRRARAAPPPVDPDLVHPDDRDQAARQLREAAGRGEVARPGLPDRHRSTAAARPSS